MITALAAVGGLAVGPRATTYPGFKPRPVLGTPGKAAYCYADYTGYEDDRAELFCWTPNDGWAVSIPWNGRRARTAYYKTWPKVVHGMTRLKGYAPPARVLRFGERWQLRCDNPGNFATCKGRGVVAFTCMSERNGLICRNAASHGLWVGRYRGYRLF